jgi:hypothetical protein
MRQIPTDRISICGRCGKRIGHRLRCDVCGYDHFIRISRHRALTVLTGWHARDYRSKYKQDPEKEST